MSNETSFGGTPMPVMPEAESGDFDAAMREVNTNYKEDSIAAKNVSFFNKKGPLGLPMGIFVVVGGFLALILISIVIAVAVKSKNADAARMKALQAKTGDNQYTMELASLREQINTLTTKVNDQARAQVAFQNQVDTRLSNSGTAGLERRVVENEEALHQLTRSQATLAKRFADNRPLADLLKRDNSATILSIGNGIARVKDELGAEHSLQKGDKWNGKTVTSVRSDTNQVVLSDGSSIL